MPPHNDSSDVVYEGSCFCGRVTYTVTGRPLLSAYCHCTICQRLNRALLVLAMGKSAQSLLDSPFIHTLHFPKPAFAWTHGEPQEGVLQSFIIPQKPWKTRWRCKQCGGCVMSHNSKTNRCSIWGAHLERDKEGKIIGWNDLKPTAHMFYGTRMLDINDSLSKWEGYENQSTQICT